MAVLGEDGQLLTHATVDCTIAGLTIEATPADDGTYYIETDGTAAKLRIEVTHPAHGTATAEVGLPGDPDTGVVVYLAGRLAYAKVVPSAVLLESARDAVSESGSQSAAAALAAPDNDLCEDAIGPLAIPSTTAGTTVDATTDGLPDCGTAITAPGVWYTVIGTGNTLTASTCNQADYDTKISVFCGGCIVELSDCCAAHETPGCDDPTCEAAVCAVDPFCCDVAWDSVCAGEAAEDPNCPCDGGGGEATCVTGEDDTAGCSLTTEVSWCSQFGAEYLILVHGFSSAVGNFDLSISDDGVPCTPDVLCLAQGGCCLPTGECVVTTEADCLAQNGEYQGDDTDCSGDVGTDGMLYESDPNLEIPDGTGEFATDTITVPDSFTIGDVNVDLEILHTWPGDLCVELEHNGTFVTLIQRMGLDAPCDGTGCCGCSADNLAGIILDDEGDGGAIEDQCVDNLTSPPYYTPDEALSAFDGMDATGDWTIWVNDNQDLDTGTLVHWSLHIQEPAAEPGACCFRDRDCLVTTEACCEFAGGAFQGFGTDCGQTVAVYDADPQLPIPDDSLVGVSDTITVPDSFTIEDVDVDLEILHTWQGDLCVEVEHDGTAVTLIKRMNLDAECDADSCCGCSADDLAGVILDDEGDGGAIEDQCTDSLTSPPNYTPEEALSAFDGMDAAGDWIIWVNDNAAGDTGSLEHWSLHFAVQGESPCPRGALDIKPGSCPNPLNRKSKGVLPVAILGEADFDVTQLDVSTLRLVRVDGVGGEVAPIDGPPGPHPEFEDVATPFVGAVCECDETPPDGIMDLSLKFRTQDVVNILELNQLSAGDEVELAIIGSWQNGTDYTSISDCVVLVPRSTAELVVSPFVAGVTVDVTPLDFFDRGAGNYQFYRLYDSGSVVQLTAPGSVDGRAFRAWVVNGVLQEAGQTTVQVTITGDATARPLYESRREDFVGTEQQTDALGTFER